MGFPSTQYLGQKVDVLGLSTLEDEIWKEATEQ